MPLFRNNEDNNMITSTLFWARLRQWCLLARYQLGLLLFISTLGAINAPSYASAIPMPPQTGQRILALTPHSVELLFAIGAGDRIIGTVSFADYPEAAKAIPRVGNYAHFNREQLLNLQPDFIVVGVSDTASPLMAQLQSLGVPIFNSSVERIEQIPHRLEELGQQLGLQATAQQAAEQFRQHHQYLRNRYQQRPSVPVFWQISPAPLMTIGAGWQSQMLRDCGGINVFDDALSGYPQINMEQVLLRQPQVIIRPEHAGLISSQLDWQQWPEIPAVAEQRILTLHGDLISRTGPRILQGLEAICQALEQARSSETNPKATPVIGQQ
ncbi:MAG: cobalamin-binding protein [Ferrimonas sp.]